VEAVSAVPIRLAAGASHPLGRLAGHSGEPAWLLSVVGLAVVLQRMTHAGGVTLDVAHEDQPARRLVVRTGQGQRP